MEKSENISSIMREKLRTPFPPEAYGKHPTKTFLTTLKAMYVTERLNDVFGIGRWTIEHEVIERTADYVLVEGLFISLDYDVHVPKQFGGHLTTGKNTEIADGFKSAVTDCQSKIASYLEIGIDMFKGKVPVKGASKDNDKKDNAKLKTLTQAEVNNWNGKIYKGNQVYIDNIAYIVGEDQLKKMKDLPKYKPNETKK